MIVAMKLYVSENRVGCPWRGDVDVERCWMCSWCNGVDAEEGGVTAVHCSRVSKRFGADLELIGLGAVWPNWRRGQRY